MWRSSSAVTTRGCGWREKGAPGNQKWQYGYSTPNPFWEVISIYPLFRRRKFPETKPFDPFQMQSRRKRTGSKGLQWQRARSRSVRCRPRPAAVRIRVLARRPPGRLCSDRGTSRCAGLEWCGKRRGKHPSCAHLGTRAQGTGCWSRRSRSGFECADSAHLHPDGADRTTARSDPNRCAAAHGRHRGDPAPAPQDRSLPPPHPDYIQTLAKGHGRGGRYIALQATTYAQPRRVQWGTPTTTPSN